MRKVRFVGYSRSALSYHERFQELVEMMMFQLGLTQGELAKLVGMSPARLSQLCTGRQDLGMRFFRQFRAHVPMQDKFYQEFLQAFIELAT